MVVSLFLSSNLAKLTTALTNGIVGQFSHLYTHTCLIFDTSNQYNQDIFRSCLLSNNNNLFQLQFYNPQQSQRFYILTYPTSGAQWILYLSSSSWYYTSSSSYCLSSSSTCYYSYSNPGDSFNFFANFSRGNTNNPLGTFTLQNIYSKTCISVDIQNGVIVNLLKTCDPSDSTQLFGFLAPDTYLMSQITSTVSTSNSILTVTWSNPSNIANVAYMMIPGNQTVSDQGTINLQNVKCTSRNGLSPVNFQDIGNSQTSVSISMNAMQLCNIYPNSNDTMTTYAFKAIHVYLDNSLGFSRTIQVVYKNQLAVEQMYLIGQSTVSSDQTQIFESSTSSFEIVNQITMSMPQSIGQTYLQNMIQNISITLNSTSKYILTLVGNSMTLVSVNATNNIVITQIIPFLTQVAGTNALNLSFDLTNTTSNYYKFKIIIKLSAIQRLLADVTNDFNSTKSTVAEYDPQEIYYIGSYSEIIDLINKKNSNNSSKTDDSNKNTIIVLSVVFSVVICGFILGCFIFRKYKKSPKKNLKYDLPALMVTSKVPTAIENNEYKTSQQRYLVHQTEILRFGVNGSEIHLNLQENNLENNCHQKIQENHPELQENIQAKLENNQENNEKYVEEKENKEEFIKQDENNEENYEKELVNVVIHNSKNQNDEPKEKIDILIFDD